MAFADWKVPTCAGGSSETALLSSGELFLVYGYAPSQNDTDSSVDLFRWKDIVTRRPTALIGVISAERFHDDNSGRGRDSSQVTFRQLGIDMKEVTEVSIEHAPAEITGGTVEIPGDHVLLKDKNTIVFSVCNNMTKGSQAWLVVEETDHVEGYCRKDGLDQPSCMASH